VPNYCGVIRHSKKEILNFKKMKKIAYLLTFMYNIFLFSCCGTVSYTIQFHNKTQVKLDSVSASMRSGSGSGYVLFQLQKDEKSKEFMMTCPVVSFWGTPVLDYAVMKYSIRDSVFVYQYGDMIYSDKLLKNKVNLINIQRDSSEMPNNIGFKFCLNK
jgi:hypothetical protein